MAEFNDEQIEDLKRAELCEKLIGEGVTGQLYNVEFSDRKGYDERYPNLSGIVAVDTRNRFWAGDKVWTSRLEKIYVENGRTFAKTHYSVYELMYFDPQDIPEDFRYAFS